MGARLCNPVVHTERSPFFFEQFSASFEDEQSGIGILPTCDDTIVREVESPSPTSFSNNSPACHYPKHRRSGSVPLIHQRVDHPNIFKNIWRGAQWADIHMQNLKLDTMSQVKGMQTLAELMQSSEDYIEDELKRQGEVVGKSNITLNDTMAELKSIEGLTSMGAKIKNFLSNESPDQLYQHDLPTFKSKHCRPRSFSGPILLPSEVGEHTLKFKSSMAFLCCTLDKIEKDAVKIKEQLELEEPDLNELDKNIDDVVEKTNHLNYLNYRKLRQLKK